jgi:hypothetical protein
MADFGVRSGGRVFDFDFPDVAEHLFRGNGLALDAGYSLVSHTALNRLPGVWLLFGIFFGYWPRSIYFRDPAQPTRFSDIITACVFLAMAFLGILGPNVVAGAFSRLTALKIGGTELTFTEGHPKGETGSNDTSLALLFHLHPVGEPRRRPPKHRAGCASSPISPCLFPARRILLPPH